MYLACREDSRVNRS